jgi:hypothetical protein
MRAFLLLLLLPWAAYAQAPEAPFPETVERTLLVISPSYFHCGPCEAFHRDRAGYEAAGMRVMEVQVSEQGAERLRITGFPTIIVGGLLVGYDEGQKRRIQKLLEKQK